VRLELDAPLSIVVFGVGEGDFSGMCRLEDRYKMGKCRDNVWFVKYAELKDSHDKLTVAALDHIPVQLVTYFVGKGISPNPEAIQALEKLGSLS
jgi:Copine